MACPSENQLLDAIEGRLPENERQIVDQHVKGCAVCRELLASSLHATTTLVEPGSDEAARPRSFGGESLVGATVGEYVVEQMIGSGGMGIVYRGSHPLLGKSVAIKILRPELAADAGHMRRMLSEARAMSSIAHRSIVDVFAFGELDDGRQYMVMEFLQGDPLNRIIRAEAPLPPARLLALLDGIVEAVAASHAAGVIHRDLKPSNLYLVRQGDGTSFVKLLDFGLAKRERDDQGHTRAGRLVLGTPGYMAPEQIFAQEVSPATDLYAIGVIAYELATGKRPFRGANSLAVMQQQVDDEPVPPSRLAGSLPAGLEPLILRLMAKAPGDRPASAEAVRAELRLLRRGRAPVRAAPFAIAGVAVAAIALLGVAALRTRAPEAAPPPVTQLVVAAPPEPPPPAVPPAPAASPPPPPPPSPEPSLAAAPSSWRLTQKALLERVGGLRRKLAKATPKGEEPDRLTTMLIKNAERDTKAARGEAELKKVERTIADIDRKYFKN